MFRDKKSIPNEFDARKWLEIMHNTIQIESMWDGFWIHSFQKNDLILSCSFDRLLYRNYNIIFKDVRFFNLPAEWRDTALEGNTLFYLENSKAFEQEMKFKLEDDEFVFGIQLNYRQFTHYDYYFHVVAKHVFTEECSKGNAHPDCF